MRLRLSDLKKLQGTVDHHGRLWEALCDNNVDPNDPLFQKVVSMCVTLQRSVAVKLPSYTGMRIAGEYDTSTQRRVWLCRLYDRLMTEVVLNGTLPVQEANQITKDLCHLIYKEKET